MAILRFPSISNSFSDVEGWLSGLTNGVRAWVAPYFNATREASYQIENRLGVKITGDDKLGPFPSWTLSTQTPDMCYCLLQMPVSDWYIGFQVAQSMETGHTEGTVHDLVDYYYGLGALINLYSHTLSRVMGSRQCCARLCHLWLEYNSPSAGMVREFLRDLLLVARNGRMCKSRPVMPPTAISP